MFVLRVVLSLKCVTFNGKELNFELWRIWASVSQRFPTRVQLLAMCRRKLPAVFTRLMSKYLQSVSKWYRPIKETSFPLPCCPMNRQCSWNKTQIEKKPIRYIWYLISDLSEENNIRISNYYWKWVGNGSAGHKVSFKRYETLLGHGSNYK